MQYGHIASRSIVFCIALQNTSLHIGMQIVLLQHFLLPHLCMGLVVLVSQVFISHYTFHYYAFHGTVQAKRKHFKGGQAMSRQFHLDGNMHRPGSIFAIQKNGQA